MAESVTVPQSYPLWCPQRDLAWAMRASSADIDLALATGNLDDLLGLERAKVPRHERQGTPFFASDSKGAKHLLWILNVALDNEATTAYVASKSREGNHSSLFLFSFYWEGVRVGYKVGEADAYDQVYARGAGARKARLARVTKAGKRTQKR